MPLILENLTETQKNRVTALNKRLEKFQTLHYRLNQVVNINAVSSLSAICMINAFMDKDNPDEMYQMRAGGMQVLLALNMLWNSISGYGNAAHLNNIKIEDVSDAVLLNNHRGSVDVYLEDMEKIMSAREKEHWFSDQLLKPLLFAANVGFGFKTGINTGLVNLVPFTAVMLDKLLYKP